MRWLGNEYKREHRRRNTLVQTPLTLNHRLQASEGTESQWLLQGPQFLPRSSSDSFSYVSTRNMIAHAVGSVQMNSVRAALTFP